MVPPLGCSKEILLTDCSLTCSDPDVPCLPVAKEDEIVEQGGEYHGFSTSEYRGDSLALTAAFFIRGTN